MPDDDYSAQAASVHRHDAAAIIRLIVVAAFIVALVLVGLDNRDDVRIGYVIGDAQAPVWIVVVSSAVAGVIIGWLVRQHRRS
jgi:uncharacterized integral membrane protein